MVINIGKRSVVLGLKRLPSQQPLKFVFKRIWQESRVSRPQGLVLLERSKTIIVQWLGLKAFASITKAFV